MATAASTAASDAIDELGGVALHLLGDMHFASRYNDDVDQRFGTATMCSVVEGPDVQRKVRNVATFPFERHELAPGVEAIPTRPSARRRVVYLVEAGGRRCLFAGDTIYHDGKEWRVFVSKKNRATMLETLDMLAEVEFDVLLANTGANNPLCHVETAGGSRREFLRRIKSGL